MAVIFDMDGVLVDNGEFHYKAWKIFCEKYTIPFSKERFRKFFFGRTNQQVLSKLFKQQPETDEIKKWSEEKEKMYREIYAPYIRPVPGLIELIHKLKEAGISIGVATSAPRENVDFVLQALGIEHQIDVIVDDSMVSHGKPHPEIYLKAAELLHTKPGDCIVFEDSLSGTKSAYDAGAKVIAVTTTIPAGQHRYAHKTIKDFTELIDEDFLTHH